MTVLLSVNFGAFSCSFSFSLRYVLYSTSGDCIRVRGFYQVFLYFRMLFEHFFGFCWFQVLGEVLFCLKRRVGFGLVFFGDYFGRLFLKCFEAFVFGVFVSWFSHLKFKMILV